MHTISATNARILNGTEDVASWTDEELLRGQRMDRNGRWTGQPPKLVPIAVLRERARRDLSKGIALLQESTFDAARFLRSVVNDESADLSDRIEAAKFIWDRVLGKNLRVDLAIEQEPRFVGIIAKALVYAPTGDDDADVIDADVIWESDGPDAA